jgi:hypothetical protein
MILYDSIMASVQSKVAKEKNAQGGGDVANGGDGCLESSLFTNPLFFAAFSATLLLFCPIPHFRH